MERGEPTLIPQWLKVSGSATGGPANHQIASSSLHSDDKGASKPLKNKLSSNTNDHGIGRSFGPERTASSYFRRSSSSNGSAHLRSHGSFGRSNRDRDWEKEIHDSRDKEKSIFGDYKRREYSDPLDNILPSRFEKDLRCSQSLTSGKLGETWPRKLPADSSNSNKSNFNNGNGLPSGGINISSVNKTAFEREFPSLGADEKPAACEMGRVSSPGLTTSIQSLPITSAMIGGDGWTSALAEVPVLVGNNGAAPTVQQTVPTTAVSLGSATTTGLNMAETLAQGPSRAQTPNPQVPVETQRLEELAIKQSRQLIPVTPSMPKALALNPSEKSKLKSGFQQQHQTSYSHLANHSPRNGPAKSDVTRTSSVGKLHVLKLARERNGVSPTAKDNSSSPTSAGRVMSSTVAVASAVPGPAPSRNPGNNANLVNSERKPTLATFEKRPTLQVQSRNDFFNLVRKNSMASSSSAAPSPGPPDSPSVLNISDGPENGCTPVTTWDGDLEIANGITVDTGSSILETFAGDQSNKNTNEMSSNGHVHERVGESHYEGNREFFSNGKGHSSSPTILYSEEEEAAFLRSLGWEESAGEDEGLTEEEINSFYKEVNQYIKLKPSSRILQGMQPKSSTPLSLREQSVGGYVSSGSSSSDSKF